MGWFYVITQDMIEWGLAGSELLVYALINGYSQKGQGCYWGSLDNTSKVCGISRATAIRTLQTLTEKGFISKSKAVVNDEFRTIYTATRVSKCDSEYQNDTAGSIKMTPNNIDDKKNKERENKRFVPPTIDEVRSYCTERGNGIDPEEFIAFYESKGWMVGKSKMKDWKAAIKTWEISRKKESKTTRRFQPLHKESVFEHNLKVMDQMFGTNMHQQAYGNKEVYDEQ